MTKTKAQEVQKEGVNVYRPTCTVAHDPHCPFEDKDKDKDKCPTMPTKTQLMLYFLKAGGFKDIKSDILTSQLVNFLLTRPDQTTTSISRTLF